MQIKSLDQFLITMRHEIKDCHVYIWGICVYGDLLGKLFEQNGILWDGYYDNFNDIEGGLLNSKPVYKGEHLNVSEKAIYILSMRNYEAVKTQLLSEGIDESCIVCFDNTDLLDNIESLLGEEFVSSVRLKSFADIHSGKKCFVIGNGPSLCIEDLNRIHHAGMISFACNMIFKCYDETMWRPDYYFFTDGIGIRKTFKDISAVNFVSDNCKYIFSRSNGGLEKYIHEIQNLVLFRYVYSKSEEEFDFSSDCSKKVYIGHTVTYAMLQMAVYMGFKEIYLLGMDHSFSIAQYSNGTVIKNEKVEDHPKMLGNYMWGVADPTKTTRIYLATKKYADSHGIKIYNATHGGQLEVFERVDFEKIF